MCLVDFTHVHGIESVKHDWRWRFKLFSCKMRHCYLMTLLSCLRMPVVIYLLHICDEACICLPGVFTASQHRPCRFSVQKFI